MILASIQLIAAASAALLLAGWLFQQIGQWLDRARFPIPGRLVSVGEQTLHVVEEGSGKPTVVLEAGLAASSLSWSRVGPLLAQFTRVVSYDRRGLGFSTHGKSARTLQQMADELATLLETAQIPSPYVLVGHSFGALIVRAFAHRRPHLVTGIVLVDPVSIDGWAACSPVERRRLKLGAKLSRRGAWLARFGVVRFALLATGWRHGEVTHGIARASAGKATAFLARLVGEVQKLPPNAVRVARSQWSGPKPFRAMARYLEALPECAEAASEMAFPEGIPLIVLSAGSATAHELQERELWIDHVNRGRHVTVEGTGHWLHLERPEIVAEVVRELIGHTRLRSMGHRIDDVVDSDTKT